MGSEEFVKAWNQAFFPDGHQLSNATLDIEVNLIFPGGNARFSVKGITPKTRINEIARLYADSLRQQQATPSPAVSGGQPEPQPEPAAPPSLKEDLRHAVAENEPEAERTEAPANIQPNREVVANKHLDYRKNTYLVQHYRINGEDRYTVFNQASGKQISPSSVTGRSILKQYREEE